MTAQDKAHYNPEHTLGLIAGGGDMPFRVKEAVQAQGGRIHILGIQGSVDAALGSVEQYPMAHLGKFIKSLKKAGCQQVVLIGKVQRPNLLTLRPDMAGMKAIARVLVEKRRGDDALLRQILRLLNENGMAVLPAQAVAPDLMPEAGNLTQTKPNAIDEEDIALGVHITRTIGALDIGQASIVCRGQVLAVEGVDGTDALLARVANLDENLRGSPKKPQGVLVKLPKPQQDRRIDIPALGLQTIENAAQACLSGIVVEAQGAIINDIEVCIKRADELGLFVQCIAADYGSESHETQQENG